jgi:hypothetical protein
MTADDTRRALMNSIATIAGRRWESPEKNNRAAELARKVPEAVNRQDQAEIEKLVKEMQQFVSPTFTLFARLERLAKEQATKEWPKREDGVVWKSYIERAALVVSRRDGDEVILLAQRIVGFLRQRNGHVLASNIEEAVKMAGRKS